MELKEYIKILKKNIFLIALFTVLGAVLAISFASKITKGHRFEQLFFINSPKEAAESAYLPSGFYAQEKARNFTDAALAIILSPDFINELAGTASLSARKIAPQVIRVSVSAADLDSAQSTLGKIKDRFNQKIIDLTGPDQFQLKPIGTAYLPAARGPSPQAVIIFGAVAGFIFALVAIGAKTYFKV